MQTRQEGGLSNGSEGPREPREGAAGIGNRTDDGGTRRDSPAGWGGCVWTR